MCRAPRHVFQEDSLRSLHLLRKILIDACSNAEALLIRFKLAVLHLHLQANHLHVQAVLSVLPPEILICCHSYQHR